MKYVALTQGDLPGSARAVGRRTKGRKLMTRQKSENCIVPEGTRKSSSGHKRGGGKAVPVEEQMGQLRLPFATAENPQGTTSGRSSSRLERKPRRVPQAKVKSQPVSSVTLEEAIQRLRIAFEKVASNKGAPGPDRQSIAQVRQHLDEILPQLSQDLLEGSYRPGAIRRVYIPKAGGGERGLGIPDVIDRMVQEAVRQVLEPLYEPHFHSSSHGFRPQRSCHTAVTEAQEHIQSGHRWVVDLDLEKFFDRVCHQRLLAQLARRVKDKRLLVLIARMLKAKVLLPDGVKVRTEEGLPQGGPLSPLLSNIVLDELDRELARRGHRFCRYADDVNIYVRSKRSGKRVMASIRSFIRQRLRLEVNLCKSAIARPEERHFLGFSLRYAEGKVEVGLSQRSRKQLARRVRELTPRNWGGTIDSCIEQVNRYLRGWFGFFGICTEDAWITLRNTDSHIRRRLRAIQLKQWKHKHTIKRKLVALGVSRKMAGNAVYNGKRSIWSLSSTFAVARALRNVYFAERGLYSVLRHWEIKNHASDVAPKQLSFMNSL